ncbi:hypothetical protein DSO57_1000010 [Entomophthora muscae]|uniref:Uncharacterized protein n=1 Tax=Entomophthora muscae TaxID=34485 RepID=A0ACC2SMF7_9FUNG|nr:hypothetical protein DSO57_1000010 [Entomophthora muscae]
MHLLLLATKSDNIAFHAGDFSYSPLPTVPPVQDFTNLGFVYITVLRLANQVVPHTGIWCPLATALNYLVRIAPIVYMAFQAQSASPMGFQLGSGMGRDTTHTQALRNLPQNKSLTPSYNYSKLGFAYLLMLGPDEQVIPYMEVWRPWATAANYVMWMAPVIYWAFHDQPFSLTEGSPGSHPGHDK